MMRLQLVELGRCDYDEAWKIQLALHAKAVADPGQSYLVLVEHPPVITLGRRAEKRHVLFGAAELERRGVQVREVDRGGDVTYHGPGQLVAYPIMQLTGKRRDVHGYFRSLEEIVIRLLADYGVAAGRIDGLTGVWIGNEKICAMGVAIKKWTTYHGLALNIDPDLRHFQLITPCGISDKGVTSLRKILGREMESGEVSRGLVNHFTAEFGFNDVERVDLNSILSNE